MTVQEIENLVQKIEAYQEEILDKMDTAEENGQYQRAENLLKDYRFNEEQIMKLSTRKRELLK